MDEKEQDLIKEAVRGSRDAFCEVYDLYKARLYRYAYYRIGDPADAEDAVSACVLSAWEQIGRLKQPESFPAWIFRILKASCAGMIAGKIRQKNEVPEETLTTEPAEEYRDPDVSIMLKEALGKLPEDSREMVLLSVVAGLTSKEIGEMYDMPQGSVRSRLSRSLAVMRKELEEGHE